MANRLISYIKESRDELKKVVWPSRRETIRNTGIVIAISLGIALYLGLADFGLTYILENVVLR